MLILHVRPEPQLVDVLLSCTTVQQCQPQLTGESLLTFSERGGQRDSVKMMMMKMFMPSMPSMPGGGEEKKEETAESREEAKEQVVNDMNIARIANAVQCHSQLSWI